MFNYGEDELTTEILYRQCTAEQVEAGLLDQAQHRLAKFRGFVQEAVDSQETFYGINTGFGYLANVRIEDAKLDQLQLNLVRSHACGTGAPVGEAITRAMLFLRVHTFSLGYSGISPECVDAILEFIAKGISPVIPEKGSVGASGDLAPLAHLALGLMGEGDVHYENKVQPADQVLQRLSLRPYKLGVKEGLSLINGTHFMTALAAFAVEEAKVISRAADIVAALSLDAIKGTVRAFDERIHNIRAHPGQIKVAENLRKIFAEKDGIMDSHSDCGKVQDPYSFRCIPQVHGAVRDTISFVENTVNTELNSVTDNPLCFENGDIVSGGNFHGEPIALGLDYLGIAVSEIGSISERRVEKLTDPAMSGLPPFVVQDSGLNSGYMIPHVVTAALASENKVLAHPASVDSIPTSADKEDHVSMGPISARKARTIIGNVGNILAIETLAACQAFDILAPLEPNPILKKVYKKVRELSPAMAQDRSLHKDIEKVTEWIQGGGMDQIAHQLGIEL